MRRRSLIPLLLVGALGLLAAGAAILGAFWAPTGTNLAVHNAAGQTLLAGTVRGAYTETTLRGETVNFVYHAPDRVTAHYSGPVKGVDTAPQSTTGAAAQNVLSPIRQLETLTGFTGRGSTYLMSESVKKLFAPAERSAVTGSFHAVATVSTGYVVRVQEHIDASQGDQHLTEHIDYRLSRIDGWTRS